MRSNRSALLCSVFLGLVAWLPQARAATVEEVVDAQGCSTSAVMGLSEQIVDEVNCLIPGALSEMPSRPNLSMGSAVFPYLQTAGRDALVEALDDHSGTTLHITSMLRTVAQQYLLYRWYLAGACGIPLAATPGSSNHEQGTAFDTGDYSTWDDLLTPYDWDWYGSSDVYHFTYHGPGTNNLSGTDVLAFQRLWNRNNPSDLIDEDGIYGPQTGARLSASPAGGFPIGAGACCGSLTPRGTCNGDVLSFCGDNGVETRDCAAEGLTCGLDTDGVTSTCLAVEPPVDAGLVDAGLMDGGLEDVEAADGSQPDAGSGEDAATATDGGSGDDASSPGAGRFVGGCGCASTGKPKGVWLIFGLIFLGLLLHRLGPGRRRLF